MYNTRDALFNTLKFAHAIQRPQTVLELFRTLPNTCHATIEEVYIILQTCREEGVVSEENGFYALSSSRNFSLFRCTQDFLCDKKFQALLRWRFLFYIIPYVDFVCVAGSLALGNVHKDSDFDVIIGCRTGHIFTVRFFAIFIFGIFGIRRKRIDHVTHARNKICLNHFITRTRYTLAPPYHIQWQYLYRNLVPLMIRNTFAFDNFIDANRLWTQSSLFLFDERCDYIFQNFFKKIFEYGRNISIGNIFEKIVKKIQQQRIERALATSHLNYTARILYSDEELEFHPDLRKIEHLLTTYNTSS